MRFIEGLRRKKEEEDATREREQAVAKARFKEHERIIAEERSQRRKEEDRLRAMRQQTLDNSVVPQLASELRRLIDGEIVRQDWKDGHMEIILSRKFDGKGPDYSTITTSIQIQALETGNIIIGEAFLGKTILNSQEVVNVEKVDEALGKAYHHPSIKYEKPHHYKYTSSPSIDYDRGGDRDGGGGHY